MTSTSTAAFVSAVCERLGAGAVLTGEACAPYECDVVNGQGLAGAVVLPSSTEAVSELMRLAVQQGVSLIAQGSRSGLVGNAIPDRSGTQVIVCLSRMQRVRELDTLNRTVVLEAGTRLSQLNQHLQPHKLQFPVDLGSDPTVGGLLANNAGGSRLLRHGDVRHNVLGVEVVLADKHGTVVQALAPLRKNNTGLDLKQLFIGTGGAFGIITAATLDLKRCDQSTQSLFVALPDSTAALKVLLAFEREFGDLLCAFEVMSAASLAITLRHCPVLRHPLAPSPAGCYALIELASSMPGLQVLLTQRTEHLLESLYREARIIDATLSHPETFWPLRDSLPLAIAQEGIPLSFDVAFSRSQLVAFGDAVRQWLQREHPLLQLYEFGHFADGGCHLVVLLPHTQVAQYTLAKIVALRNGIYQRVAEHGGCFSAEHGVGPVNAAYYNKYTAPQVKALSRTLQQVFDPQAILGRYRYT